MALDSYRGISEMWMTNEEIARSFRNSNRRGTQIRVLAELNLCKPHEIKEVLIEMGELQEQKAEKKVEKKVVKKAEVKTEGEVMKVPEVIIQLAVEKMDSIEERIKIIEKQKKELEDQYQQIAEFLDGR